MSTDREVTRIVRSWLEDGATALPDRVLDAVLDQVPATPQRRTVWSARRLPDMNSMLKIALSAAAVVVVAVIGINLLPGSGGPGGSTQTPVPSVTPAPSPSASPGVAMGSLEPGTYRIDTSTRTTVPFTFTVPAGWTARADGFVYKNADQADELGFSTTVVTHVYTDACKSEGTLTEVGPTVEDLVSALVGQVGSEKTTPASAELGGLPATRIDISVPADLDTSTCRHPGEVIQIWADEAESDFFAIPATPSGQGMSVYIADVAGERVVIVTGPQSGRAAAELAELQEVVDSIRFEP